MTLQGHTDWVRSVSIFPDGDRAISASNDRTLKVWDLKTRKDIMTLQGHTDWVRSVSIFPDGDRAISASGDNTLKVWDMKTGQVIASFTGESGMLSCAVAQDGVTIAAGDKLGRVHFLRLMGV